MKDIIISAHQPQFLPYLGYIHKIKYSDVFVVLDDVQFKKNEWQNRNRVKGKDGIIWLTVPVIHNFGSQIREIVIRQDIHWQRKHKNTIKTYYSKAEGFYMFGNFLPLWEEKYEKLIDVNMRSIKILLDIFGINTKIIFSSELEIKKTRTERLIAICKELGAKAYLSGIGAKNYLDEELFKREGIEIIWQEFHHPQYKQLWGEFIPNLSAIDMVMNVGMKCKDMI